MVETWRAASATATRTDPANAYSYVITYDEAEGYADGGIAPGTKWEDVPDDFTCPLSGADKSMFEAQ